jgi:hypothetical protein
MLRLSLFTLYGPILPGILAAITPYLPVIGIILPFVLGLVALLVQGKLHGFARETVAAVYRVAVHAANDLQDEGLAWLRSEAGIAYRQHLAELAYDSLPATVYGVPVGLIKTIVSRERWVALVEAAFQEVCSLAEKLELPGELPQG